MSNPKKIPSHAYSFSASLLLSTVGALSECISNNHRFSMAAFAGGFLFAVHGLYDLQKEHRLQRLLNPFKNIYASFFQPAANNEVPSQPVAAIKYS